MGQIGRKNRPLEVGKIDSNKNDINNNNDINNIYNQSINLNILEDTSYKKEKMDVIDYSNLVKENLDLELLDSKKFERIYPIYTIICDILNTNSSEKILINNTLMPIGVIQKRFLKEIKLYHVEYVLDCINEQKNIKNMRKYIITSLYNSISTIGIFYENKMYNELNIKYKE